MVQLNLEQTPKKESKTMYSFRISLNLCLRAFINKGLSLKTKSQSFKIILVVNMILGFIVLSYYKAQMNAALNVDNSEVPFRTWEDIANSDKKLLIWNGSLQYDWFKDTKEPIMKRIYNENLVAINNLGFNGTVPLILDGDYLALSISGPYFQMEEYPCQLIPLTHKELR